MPIEYNDQFFIIDPSFPPPSGTVLNPVNYTLIDTDEDNFIESGETINGRTIASVFNGDTITVTMNGVTTTITGTTFYLNGPGPNAVFTPSSPGDTTVLSQAIFQSSTFVTSSTRLPVTDLGPPCFTPGTRLNTPNGPRLVEDLAVGDLVNTRDNGPQRLRWIGTRTVDARGKFAPIRFEAGAIGNNRALEVSPQHRILITSWQAEILFGAKEVLVAAKFLVNGNTIRAVPRDNVTYIHLLFDQHEIVISEGVPSESYHIAHAFAPDEEAVREELLALFPELFSQRGANMQTVRKVLRSYEAALLRAA